MHEILFRGKNIDNGHWMYGTPISLKNGETYMNFEFMGMIDRTLVIPETVGQYTGLTDKNGKKIFEGDIIRDEDGDAMVVKWQTEGAVFVLEPEPYVSVHFYDTLPSKIEVIGNIYDNPELMGGNK